MTEVERSGLAESMLDASFGHTAAIIAKAYLEAKTESARQDAVIERLGDAKTIWIEWAGTKPPPEVIQHAQINAMRKYAIDHRSHQNEINRRMI